MSKASGAGIFAPDRECMGEPTAVRQKPSSVSIGAGWCFFTICSTSSARFGRGLSWNRQARIIASPPDIYTGLHLIEVVLRPSLSLAGR